MHKLKLTAGIAVLCTALAASAASADEQTGSVATCLDMAQQVKTALASNAQSANYQEAMREEHNGRDFCSNSFYQTGINHYSHALSLLGVSKG
ncbi:MAG: hypothetical protein ABSA49_06175 [Rhizomicrobium sp.]|jgi:hypothetical protein